MTSVMPTFDIFVLPAVFDYSPFAVLEARMLGLPVIAGRSGAIPEMVRHGIDGILLDDKSDEALFRAISNMVNNPQLARGMGKRAKEHALAEYSADQNYPLLLDHLATLAGLPTGESRFI
jgi:glycosyltransferase involved in cell wall biosynthesis